ncbi:MAG: hypothetical protein J6P20_07670 [Oscillospiraceae bacterium]|nr:hypothetical protein [Oscillospiraceae bacterium]
MKSINRSIIVAITIIIAMLPKTAVISYAEDYKPYDRMQDYIVLEGGKPELSEDVTLQYCEIPINSFTISNLSPDVTTDLDYTDWWFSEWEDCRYIFLPVTADREQLIISYSAYDTVKLNGEPIRSGETTSLLSDADTFQITVGDVDCGMLKIMQYNLGCIYLSTSHDGLDTLDNNRSISETGKALMLNTWL